MTNTELVLHSSLTRRASSKHLHFTCQDFPEIDPPEWHKFVTVELENGEVRAGNRALGYYGSLEDNYSAQNLDYLKGDQS